MPDPLPNGLNFAPATGQDHFLNIYSNYIGGRVTVS
jgi:hypothetical protein